MTTVPEARQTIVPPFFLATNSMRRDVLPTFTIRAVATIVSPAWTGFKKSTES
jgi:hypothetical protein